MATSALSRVSLGAGQFAQAYAANLLYPLLDDPTMPKGQVVSGAGRTEKRA